MSSMILDRRLIYKTANYDTHHQNYVANGPYQVLPVFRFSHYYGKKKEDGDHRSYRTHLIFAGKRDGEGAGGQGSSSHGITTYLGSHQTHHFSSHSNHPFAQPQQLRPYPVTESGKRKVSREEEHQKGVRNKQVSFGTSGNNRSGTPVDVQQSQTVYYKQKEESPRPDMLEVVAGLSRDCFIIPLTCVDRFLPAGVTLPELKSKNSNDTSEGKLNILEVADPQLAVVIHLMTPLIPVNPPLESPLSQPEKIQRNLATKLLQKNATEKLASNGLLLASMEASSDFPLIALYVVPKTRTDATDFLDNSRRNALDTFDPSSLGYCGENFFHLCREVATIARPPFDNNNKKGRSSTTGYIISIFRVFDGDDREKLERNWLYWTGARTLYRHLPKTVGLKRITLHKSDAVQGDKLYLLLCECANFLENVNSAAQLLPSLRARLCGYVGIYRVASTF